MAAREAAVALRSRLSFSLVLINPTASQISQSRDYLKSTAFQEKNASPELRLSLTNSTFPATDLFLQLISVSRSGR